jgi:hypothetical protein
MKFRQRFVIDSDGVKNITIESDPDGLRTSGLRSVGSRDLHLRQPPPGFEEPARALLRTLADYASSSEKRLEVGHKISYGYWTLVLEARSDGNLEVLESTEDGSAFVRGADITLRYWVATK